MAARLERDVSQASIARELGLSRATVSYHARKLGKPPWSACARRYDWDEVQRYYDAGNSRLACRLRLGFASKTWYDAVERGALVPRPAAAPIAIYLVAGRVKTNRTHLKLRLIAAGLKSSRCEQCGLTEWRGRPLSIALHHANGNGKDNRLENLIFLCPNCHSQTASFAGRNARRAAG